jgi:ATP-binding cassette, subfamily C, bacterial LapB
LPVVLLLKEQRACILTKIDAQGNAEIIYPETGEGVEQTTVAELEKKYEGYSIFIKPIYDFNSQASLELKKPNSQNWFWSVIAKAIPIYGEVMLASLFINLFTLASPLFVMNVYDRVVPNNAMGTLWVLAIGALLVFGFDFVLRNLRSFYIDFVGKKVDTDLSAQTFAQLLDAELGARPSSIGSLTNTVHGFESFRDFITSASMTLIIDVPFALLFIVVMGILGVLLLLWYHFSLFL